jgi:uncharacterized membrane protein YhaH (DUF805 family)
MFSGRISRIKFVLFTAPVYLLSFIFQLLIPDSIEDDSELNLIVVILLIISSLFFMIYVIALHNKRFHDLGLSGWFQLLIFGPLGSLLLALLPGQKHSNKYGDPPK